MTLEEELQEYITRYSNNLISDTAISALEKTFKSHNITIQDWNALIETLRSVNNKDAYVLLINTVNAVLGLQDKTSQLEEECTELVSLIQEKVGQREVIIVADTVSQLGNLGNYAPGQMFYVKEVPATQGHIIFELQDDHQTLKVICAIEDLKDRIIERIDISHGVSDDGLTYQIKPFNRKNQRIVYTEELTIPFASHDTAGIIDSTDKDKLDNIEQTIHDEVSKYGVHKLTKNSDGDNFETEEELESATVFYYRGVTHTPDANDFVIVERYGEVGNEQPARFSFDGETWTFDYLLNNLTISQQQALNSGATAEKIAKIEVNESAIANLADEVDGKFILVGTGTKVVDDTVVPNLTVENITTIKNAIANKKTVKVYYTGDRTYYVNVLGAGEDYCMLMNDDGFIITYHVVIDEVDVEVVKNDGKTYTAGEGINIDSNTDTISVDTDVIATAESVENEKTAREQADSVLSASIGTEEEERIAGDEALQEQVDNLKSRGRYLSNWDAATGLATTNPQSLPYDYRAGDYFIIGNVGTTNYKPAGTQYTGVASTTVETEVVAIGDEYLYDGTQWVFQKNKPIDLTNYAKLDGENTFTEEQKSNGGIKFGRSDTQGYWTVKYNEYNNLEFSKDGVRTWLMDSVSFFPWTNNTQDIGKNGLGIRNVYLVGSLKDGTNSVTVADISNGLLNVINAADIVDNTLTQAQYDLMTNGKPTLVKGTLLGLDDSLLLPTQNNGSVWRGIMIGTPNGSTTPNISNYQINISNKQISNVDGSPRIKAFLQEINGKSIPAYSTGYLHYDGANLQYLNDSPVDDTSSSTFSGGLLSKRSYRFTTELTALSIATLDIQTGDLNPHWSIRFKVGSGFAFSSTPTIVWKDGTPNWTSLVGEEIEIVFEASLTSGTYNAWVI